MSWSDNGHFASFQAGSDSGHLCDATGSARSHSGCGLAVPTMRAPTKAARQATGNPRFSVRGTISRRRRLPGTNSQFRPRSCASAVAGILPASRLRDHATPRRHLEHEQSNPRRQVHVWVPHQVRGRLFKCEQRRADATCIVRPHLNASNLRSPGTSSPALHTGELVRPGSKPKCGRRAAHCFLPGGNS
jgi:hypothetical protein